MVGSTNRCYPLTSEKGVGARCSDDPATLVPADVAVMEMGSGRRN